MSGGSESVDSAIRLAHGYHVCNGEPDRWKVIGRWPSYHGVTHRRARRRRPPGPARRARTAVARLPPRRLGRRRRAGGDDRGPGPRDRRGVHRRAGDRRRPAAPWCPRRTTSPRVAEICRRNGVLFIVDEVMTGVRPHRPASFGIDHWDVVPDILVGGKGLSGGYAPMGGPVRPGGGDPDPGRQGPDVHVLHLRRPVVGLRHLRPGAADHGGRAPGRALRHRWATCCRRRLRETLRRPPPRLGGARPRPDGGPGARGGARPAAVVPGRGALRPGRRAGGAGPRRVGLPGGLGRPGAGRRPARTAVHDHRGRDRPDRRRC